MTNTETRIAAMKEKLMSYDITLKNSKNVSEAMRDKILACRQRKGPIDEYFNMLETKLWKSSEISCVSDAQDYKELSPAEKSVVKTIVLFFLLGDKVILDNLEENMMNILGGRDDIKKFFTLQAYNETIHIDTYEKLAFSILTRNYEELNRMLADNIHRNSVRMKILYGIIWTQRKDVSDVERIFSFICNEGIFFFTQFKIISAIRCAVNKMKGLDTANQFIRADETIHRDAGIRIAKEMFRAEAAATGEKYGYIKEKYESRFIEIVKECVDIEIASIEDIFDGIKISYIDPEDMIAEAKCCANDIAELLEYNPVYDVERPPIDYTTVETDVKTKSNIWEEEQTYTDALFSVDIDYSKI